MKMIQINIDIHLLYAKIYVEKQDIKSCFLLYIFLNMIYLYYTGSEVFMNNNLKNILLFIREAMIINKKNIYTVDNYDIHYDYYAFLKQYNALNIFREYTNLSIDSDEVVFKLKYINEDKKRKIPSIPNELIKYIELDNGNDIVSLIDNLEVELEKDGLLSNYRDYDNEIKEINKYNSLIDSYNSKYMKLYTAYKRINDYEEKIEVILGHKLMVWKDCLGNSIRRYIFEANLDIYLDAMNNVIELKINKEKFRGLVTEFLNLEGYKIKDINLLNSFVKEFNENIVNSEYDLDDIVNKYINYASFDNEIINEEYSSDFDIKNNKTYIFDNYGIIVRDKNTKLWIDDLKKIIDMCDDTKFVSPVLNLLDSDFSNEELINEVLNDKISNKLDDEDVLFPLPSNEEQYKIVEKVKNNNIVLVQGPPGTGKSHTIANLLSHYISQGKKVIVTSEKAKALEVLRNKIPEKIRSLSLALLSSRGVDKGLEYSIENIIKNQKDENDIALLKNEIDDLYNKLKIVKDKKVACIRRITQLMMQDTVSHKEELKELMNGEGYKLMDIAIYLEENRKFDLIPKTDSRNYLYNDTKNFFEELDGMANDIKENKFDIYKSVPEFNHLKDNDIELFIKEYTSYKNYSIINVDLINAVKQSCINEQVVNEIETFFDNLIPLYESFDKEWISNNSSYKPIINKVKEILGLIKINTDLIIETEELLYDNNVELDDNKKFDTYISVLNRAIDLYKNDELSFMNKIKLAFELKNLSGLSYNSTNLSKNNITKNDLVNIMNILEYYRLINLIRYEFINVLDVDLFQKLNIPSNQFGRFKDKIISLLNGFINYNDHCNKLNELFNTIINTNLYPFSYNKLSVDDMRNVISDLKCLMSNKTSNNKIKDIVNEIKTFYKDYNLKFLNNMITSIEQVDLEGYLKNRNLLINEINIINKYNKLKDKYGDLVREKSGLIENYIYKYTIDDRLFLKNNIDDIFKYHYIHKYYLDIDDKEQNIPKLYKERENLIREEMMIIENLVVAKGWYYQNLSMTSSISTSLNKWFNIKKKLGKGSGRQANIYIRQMREEMNVAKNAIPVWIMPIDKVIEQYPFSNEPDFDILIMDESSQSSMFSLSALTRAKKIVIVGDDKQISPTNAFSSIDSINELRYKYLKGNYWDLQISKDTSIYDLVQTVCGNKKITLTEHFRCLPEIIHYSNKEFYNMEINPLKVRSKENTIKKPIKTVYVPDAVCEKKGSQLYNQKEIDYIISLIGEIINDDQYNNKTIGIIVLQNSSKYVQTIYKLIMRNYSENLINERKIKVGTTYDFQGDERDVIILSMVVCNILDNGERYSFRALTTQEFNKSFNVAASRAKEQMILVHSVKLGELSVDCNRYKLLNYCLNYEKGKEKNNEKLFESQFEKDVYEYLTSKDYELKPQFKVGKYRIDFVLENDLNQKIAIECDGDKYHDIEQLDYDLNRQSVLERCGWKFARIRASEFYYDREKSMKRLMEEIDSYLNNHII